MKPLLISIDDTVRMLGIGKTTAFKLISQKQLVIVRIGRRTLVTMSSVEALISGGQVTPGSFYTNKLGG